MNTIIIDFLFLKLHNIIYESRKQYKNRIFEEWINNPKKVVGEIHSFLDIKSFLMFRSFDCKIRNASFEN